MIRLLACVFLLQLVPACLCQCRQQQQQQCPDITAACGANPASTLKERLRDASVPGVNGGDVISTADMGNFIRAKYDLNGDGCLGMDEWAQTNLNTVLTSHRYETLASFSTPCATGQGIEVSNIFHNSPRITTSAQRYNIESPLEYLTKTCEAKPELYSSDCDCAQLPDACRDPEFANLPVCVAYNAATAGRQGVCIFNPPTRNVVSAQNVCSDLDQVKDNPVLQVFCALLTEVEYNKKDWVASLLEDLRPFVDLGGKSGGRSRGKPSGGRSRPKKESKKESSDEDDEEEEEADSTNLAKKILKSFFTELASKEEKN